MSIVVYFVRFSVGKMDAENESSKRNLEDQNTDAESIKRQRRSRWGQTSTSTTDTVVEDTLTSIPAATLSNSHSS